MDIPIVLSHFQVDPHLGGHEIGQVVEISTDLGISNLAATVEEEGMRFPDGKLLTWKSAREIAEADTKCFRLIEGEITPVRTYSEETGRVYSLMPTKEAPTLLISGIPMHRIKGITPNRDTQAKINAAGSIFGKVLDTATGLGYTAIEASKTADKVITIELDPAVLRIAEHNPWSYDLFMRSNIKQLVGDSFDLITELESEQFSVVIHDPPTIALAGDLYSGSFYGELYRVLKSGGRLFHYVGNPDTRSGRRLTEGVIRRLHNSGFAWVRKAPGAFGVLAKKE